MEKHEDVSQELFILNQITVEKLFELGADVFTLYAFYYKTAKWQKTTCVWANNEYVMKKLGWGRDKVIKTKKILQDCNFIVQTRILNNQGKVVSWNIKLNYISTPLKNENSTPLNLPPVENQDAYIYNNNKISNDSYNNNSIKTRINYVNTVKSEQQTCNFDPENVKNEWNAIAKKINLAEIRAMTPDRIKKLNMRLKEQKMTIEQFFKELRAALNESPFLRGKKWHDVPNYPQDSYWEDTEWRADFDFFLQPSSLQKVIEGKYADPALKGKYH